MATRKNVLSGDQLKLKPSYIFVNQSLGQGVQRGVILLEALVAMVIFSAGILGLVGLMAASTRNSTEALFRANATLLAQGYIGQMRAAHAADAKDTLGTIATYTSPSGAAFVNWKDNVVLNATNPNFLPGNLPPTVTAAATTSGMGGTNPLVVVVTLNWKASNSSARTLVMRTELESYQ